MSALKKYIITKKDLDADNYYVGDTDLTDFDGAIELEENLGCVKFKDSLRATVWIKFASGDGIQVGDGIKAGDGSGSGSGSG